MKFADFYKAPDAAPSSSANRNPAAQMTAHPNSDVNPLLAVDLTDLERLMNGQLKPLNQVVLGYTPVKDTEGVEASRLSQKISMAVWCCISWLMMDLSCQQGSSAVI